MGTWRESRVLLIVAGMAVLAAVPAILTVTGVRNAWVLGSATGAAAVVVAVAAVWQERYKRVAQRRDEQALKIEEGCLVLGSGRLPKVREIGDPIALGVHPSVPAGFAGEPGSRVPAYVPRDIDGELRECLARGGFVVLVGHSTAGKSRTAYEAMTATLPDHVLIAPANREALSAAVGKAAETKTGVLWLNDLEHFLGSGGGLTRTQVTRLLSGDGHHRVILATLRAVEERRFTEEPLGADDSARVMNQHARETLEQAHRIGLPRLFTSEEQDRASARSWDSRIADALEHAGEYGIAEYLAAGPELLRDLDNAWEADANPRGAALVTAAIDCRRGGYSSALPKQLLEEVHEAYLEARGGSRLRPENLDEAWAWAMRARRSTTALLHPGTDPDTVQVFDYLVDHVQRLVGPTERVPEQVTTAALRYAAASDAAAIADLAYTQGRYPLAAQAWTQAYTDRRTDQGDEHPATLTSRNNLALVLRGLGRLEEAESEHRAVLRIERRVLGEDHPETLASHNNLAAMLHDLGRLEEAESEHRAVLRIQRRVLGEKHPATLISWNNLASVFHGLGRLAEAESEHHLVLQVLQRVLGEDHPDTLISRNNLASVFHDSGRLAEAESEHRAVLQIRRRVLGEDHPATLISRNNLATVLRDLWRWEEAETEHRAVLQICRRVLGEEHPHTLRSRNSLAAVLHDLRRLEEAESEHRAVLQICRRVLGENHPDTLTSRNNLATVLDALGRLDEGETK